MVSKLNISIGGIQLNLIGSCTWDYGNRPSYVKFVSDLPPTASYQVIIDSKPKEPTSQPLFYPGELWKLYRVKNKHVIWIPSANQNPYLAGSFDTTYLSGEIYTTPSENNDGSYIFPLSFPMGELLTTSILGTGIGIMLHSCGLVDGQDGIVFAGFSSAGKTTTARLWCDQPDVRILNDDHIILRKVDGDFRVYGTPWHGQGGFALAEDVPLTRIFLLKHAHKNVAVRLTPAQAAAGLLARSFAPLWSAAAMTYTLQFLDELCQSVPCYEFGFVPDSSSVDFVRCLAVS